jgi:hypothetical protein
VEFLTSVQKLLQMGYTLYGTAGTAAFYSKYGLLVTPLDKPEHLKRAVARRRSSVGMTDNAEERARLAFAELEEAEGARKMSQQQSEQRSPSRGSGVLVESTSSTPVVLTPRDASNGSTGTRAEAQQLPNLLEVLKTGSIELVINVPNVADPLDLSAGYHLRRTAIDFSVPLVSNMKNAIMLTEGLEMMAEPGFQWEIKSWESYLRAAKIEA